MSTPPSLRTPDPPPHLAAKIFRLSLVLAVGFGWLAWWLGGFLPPEPWIQRADNAGILLGFVLASIAAGFGIAGLVFKARIRAWWRRTTGRHDARVGARLDIADKVQAIVLPVSHPETPSWIIQHLQPEHVALLFSEGSREKAFQIEREHQGRTVFEPSVAELEQRGLRLADPHDLGDSKHLAQWFIRRFRDELRIPQERIFVDTTGGTKPMSLGAFQAAEESHVSSIYVLGRGEGARIHEPTDRDQGDPRFMSDWTEPNTRQ